MPKNEDRKRTKGNLKASKSDKAAMFLLENQGYIGATSAKLTGFVPIDFDLDSKNIDDNFRTILRRMEKKDVDTRSKAFLELLGIIDNEKDSKYDALVSILPYLPRLYTKSAIDPSPKLREVAQKTICAYVKLLGKRSTPELKSFFPVWFFGQFDNHKPTAVICTNGIADVFPDKKISEVIKYTIEDLLSFFDGRLNLCSNTITKEPDNVPLLLCCFKFFVELIKQSRNSSDLWSRIEIYFDESNNLWKCFKKCRDVVTLKGIFSLISILFSDEAFVKDLVDKHSNTVVFLLKHSISRLGTHESERYQAHINSHEHWHMSISIVKALKNNEILWENVDLGHLMDRIYFQLSGQDLVQTVGTTENLLTFISYLPVSEDRYERNFITLFINLPLKRIKEDSLEPNLGAYLISLIECGRYVSAMTVEKYEDFFKHFIYDFVQVSFQMAIDRCFKADLRTIIYNQYFTILSYLEKKKSNSLCNKAYEDLSAFLKEKATLDNYDKLDSIIEISHLLATDSKSPSSNSSKWKINFVQDILLQLKSNDSMMTDVLLLQQYFNLYSFIGDCKNPQIESDEMIEQYCLLIINHQSDDDVQIATLLGWLKMIHRLQFSLTKLAKESLIKIFHRVYVKLTSAKELGCLEDLAYFTLQAFGIFNNVVHLKNYLIYSYLECISQSLVFLNNSENVIKFKRKILLTLYPFDNEEVIGYMAKFLPKDDLFKVLHEDERLLYKNSLLRYLKKLAIEKDDSIYRYVDSKRELIIEMKLESLNSLFRRIKYSYYDRIDNLLSNLLTLNSEHVFIDEYIPAILEVLIKMKTNTEDVIIDELTDFFTKCKDSCKSDENDLKLSQLWFDAILNEIYAFSNEFEKLEIVPNWKSRLLFHNYALVSASNIQRLLSILRLLKFGQTVCFHSDLLAKSKTRIKCLGILRAWINYLDQIEGASEDLETLTGEIKTGSRITHSINYLWLRHSSEYTLDELIDIKSELPNEACKHAWSATLLVRFLHTKPLSWPKKYRESFIDLAYASEIPFDDYTSIVLPGGVFWKYSTRSNIIDKLDKISETFGQSGLAIIMASFASMGNAAPSYLTSFLPFIFMKPESKDKSPFEEISTITFDEFTPDNFQTIIGFQRVIETSFLLWQPWQWVNWSTLNSMKKIQKDSDNVGLATLGFRLRQYRPRLDKKQWDSILYNLVCWIIKACKEDLSLSEEIFAASSFRCLASIGALFIEQASLPSLWFDEILSKRKDYRARDDLDEKRREIVMANFDFDNNSSDSDDDLSELEAAIQAIEDDEEEIEKKNNQKNTSQTSKLFSADDSQDEIEDEDEAITSTNQESAILKRVRPPIKVRQEWCNFFVQNIFPPLIDKLLNSCLPAEKKVFLHMSTIKSLCAALSTCPIGSFYACISKEMITFKKHIAYNSVVHNVTKNLKFDIDDMTPHGSVMEMDCLVDFASCLIYRSDHLAGQLLGHNILSRLVSSIGNSGKRFSEYLLTNMSSQWLNNITGDFNADLNNKLSLYNDSCIINWGKNPMQDSWSDDEHRELIGYLLSWDCIISIFTNSKPRLRSKLQGALMNENMLPYLDKFVVIIGRLLPHPSRIESLLTRPSNLDIDLRLLATHSSRTKSMLNLSGILSHGQKKYKVKHIAEQESVEDLEWLEIFNRADRLVEWPNERLSFEISHFALHLFKRFLSEAPSLIRFWTIELQSRVSSPQDSKISPFFNKPGQAKQLAGHFEKFVMKFFSDIIIKESLFNIQQRAEKAGILKKSNKKKASTGFGSGIFSLLDDENGQQKEGTISIKTNMVSKEVSACYQADSEHSIELIIIFPENYPISPFQVTHGRKTGVSMFQWQGWLVQLSVFLNHQNGSILDGIELWHSNIKKKFDGYEECVICASIVHSKTFTLPKMQCRVCKKKFHQDCLYRWYATSNNPTCPMCRSLLTVN